MAVTHSFTDGAGFIWDFGLGTLVDFSLGQTVEDGANDAYDAPFLLTVDGASIDAAGIVSGRAIDLDTFAAGDISVSRSVLVSDAAVPATGFARILESITNTGAAAQTIMTIASRFGGGGATAIQASPAGDLALSAATLEPLDSPAAPLVLATQPLLPLALVTPAATIGPNPGEGAVDDNRYAIALAYVPDDTLFPNQWHLNNTGQSGGLPGVDLNLLGIWDEFTGAGVTIGIWDDGVEYDHADLNDNYDTGLHITVNATVHDPNPEDTDSQHGTAVAGVIAAENDGVGTVGVAFDATIAGVDIFFDSVHDFVATSAMTSELDTFDVTNHSWGFTVVFAASILDTDPFFDSFFRGIEDSTANGRGGLGTINLVAAGNDRAAGRDSNDSNFTNLPQTISVAAVGHDGFVAGYSTPGAANLVSGPSDGPTGSGIWTTDRTGAEGYSDGANQAGNSSDDYTSSFGGTSSATPAVTGVVALMLQANPLLGWRDVQDILAMTARHTGSALGGTATGTELYDWQINGASNWNAGGMHFSNDYGFGLVDAFAAVRLAESWTEQDINANWAAVVSGSWTGSTVIADNTPAGESFTLSVTDTTELEHVGLVVRFDTASLTGDYLITLTSPSGTISTLSRPENAGDAVNGDFFLSSNAFRGESGVGDWIVNVSDQLASFTGTLEGLQLEFYGNAASADDIYVFTNEYGDLAGGAFGHGFGVVDTNDGADTINLSALTSDSTVVLDDGGIIDGINLGSFANVGTEITGIENVIGGDGNDSFTGNADGNSLSGMRGGDTLSGLGGADVLDGGAGADVFLIASQVDFDGDTIEGGADTDTIRFTSTTAGQALILSSQVTGVEIVEIADAAGVLTGTTALDLDAADVNNGLTLRGNAGANVIAGTVFTDQIFGGGGADTIDGGIGTDTIDAGGGNDSIIVGLGEGNDIIDGGSDVDTVDFSTLISFSLLIDLVAGTWGDLFNIFASLTSIESAITSVGNDVFVGNALANSLNGNGGTDTVSYASSSVGVQARLSTGAGLGGFAQGDTYVGIENVTGSGFDDTIVGSDAVGNVLSGGAGKDTILGRAGVDTLNGDAGNDTLDGGTGADALNGGTNVDTVSYAGSTSRVEVRLTTGLGTFGEAAGDTYSSIENVTGSGFDDILVGDDAGNNLLRGGNGADTLLGRGGADTLLGGDGDDLLDGGANADAMAGGAGTDTVSYAGATTQVEVRLSTGAGKLGHANFDSYASIENVIGSAFGDTIVGSNLVNNRLEGGAGNDTLIGNSGNDTLIAGTGRDTLLGGANNDAFIFASAADSGTGGQRDTIFDFEDAGDNDSIVLTGFAGTLAFIGTAAFSAANQVRAVTSGANVLVQINTTGTSGAESEILLANTTLAQIDASDFFL